MSNRHRLSPEERALFRQQMAGVRRLRHDRASHDDMPKPRPVPQKRLEDEAQVMIDALSDEFEPDEIDTGEELNYCRPGLQKTVFRKLKRGQYSVEDELDLHGYTVTGARAAVAHFLNQAQERNIRCVRIIHGKGNSSKQQRPVIKTKINSWLRQRNEVLAFCSARRIDGGTGAVYVLLRRK